MYNDHPFTWALSLSLDLAASVVCSKVRLSVASSDLFSTLHQEMKMKRRPTKIWWCNGNSLGARVSNLYSRMRLTKTFGRNRGVGPLFMCTRPGPRQIQPISGARRAFVTRKRTRAPMNTSHLSTSIRSSCMAVPRLASLSSPSVCMQETALSGSGASRYYCSGCASHNTSELEIDTSMAEGGLHTLGNIVANGRMRSMLGGRLSISLSSLPPASWDASSPSTPTTPTYLVFAALSGELSGFAVLDFFFRFLDTLSVSLSVGRRFLVREIVVDWQRGKVLRKSKTNGMAKCACVINSACVVGVTLLSSDDVSPTYGTSNAHAVLVDVGGGFSFETVSLKFID